MSSLAPASGAVFSLLPPENATGNFTKVVQRVPVRIDVPADVLKTGRLRAGLSVVVDVDSRTAPARDQLAAPLRESRHGNRDSNDRRSAPARPAEPPMELRRIIAFLAMVFGMFMAILDIQIVSASLAEIQAGLSASSDEISWVQTAYLIAEVIMIPLSGFLGRLLSTRVLFTVSAAGFTAASALCATATNIDQMIVYRAIQGFIGGGMIPSVFAAAFTIFPPSRRAIVSPMIGLVATLAPTIGPTVGGYISHAFSWHWLFLVNVVPGILVATAAWTLIDFDKPNLALMKKFDWWGLAGMAAFLGSLEYVLEEGPNNDWLQDDSVFLFSIVLGVGAIVFFYRVFTQEEPIVDLRAFGNVNFAFGSVFSFVMGIGLYGLTYLYPVFLGRIRGYDSHDDRRGAVRQRPVDVHHGADHRHAVAQDGPARHDDDRLLRLCRRHLADDQPHRRLGFLRIADPADPARRVADAVHGADQQCGARHAVARQAEERIGPVQPHPQPRRRRRAGGHQHRAHRPQHLPLFAAGRACALGRCGSREAACRT